MTTALQSFRNTYASGLQAPALPTDPLITSSSLAAALTLKASTGTNSDISALLGVSGGGVDVRAAETTVASAGTTDLGALTTQRVAFTGSTTITSFGTAANCLRFIRFTSALALTHNGSSLILPTAASITTAAGDTALAASDASGNWRVFLYQRADGTALVGSALGAISYSSAQALTPAQRIQAKQNIGSQVSAQVSVSAATTLLASSANALVYITGAGYTVTLPSVTALGSGETITLFNNATTGSAAVSIAISSSDTSTPAARINISSGLLSTLALYPNQCVTLVMLNGAWYALNFAAPAQTTVRTDIAQTFSTPQQLTVRTNIAAAGSGINTDIASLLGPSSTGIDLRAAESAITASATTDLGTLSTLRAVINGTTPITSFGTTPNCLRYVRFANATTLAYNATSLNLPTAANVAVAAGDAALLASDVSGNWRVLNYQKADGTPLAGATGNSLQRNVYRYVGTSGQTVFSGSDANNNVLGYNPGYADVFWDGRLLSAPDFTATSGNSVVFSAGVNAGDEIVVIAQSLFPISNAITSSAQGLTAPQQAQVRQNIGAASAGINTDITSLAGPSLGAAKATTPAVGDTTANVATTAFTANAITTALTTYAPLASPALTGTPTAPTAAAGDSSNLIASTSFVSGAISSAVNTAVALAPSRDDVRSLAVLVAKLKGSVANLFGGVADDFKDSTGVDTTNSVNLFYDTTNNLISNKGQETSASYPAMTGNDSPSGYAARSSGLMNGSGAAFQAFDHSPGYNSADEVITSGLPGWVYQIFPTAQNFVAYKIANRPGGVAMTAWQIYGSNNNFSTATLLDSRSGYTFTGATYDTFQMATPGTYTGYQLYVTANQANNAAYIPDIQFLKGVTGAFDARSVAFSAQAVPTKASVFVMIATTAGTTTLNSNLVISISRDGGTTWTPFSLSQTGTLGSYAIYEGNGLDISAQPSGSNMKWRIQTIGTTLGIAVDAIVTQWG